MFYKKLIHMIVFCCILGGIAIMAYADVKKRALNDTIPVKTSEKCNAEPIGCKRIS